MNFYYNFTDSKVVIADVIIVLVLLIGIYTGYKRGFLESAIRFIGICAAFVISFLFKNPISVYLYTHLPFFKFGGVFKGVSVLNILIYEFIAFVLVFLVILVILKIIYDATGLVNKLFSVVAFLGLPNKILGAIVGFLGSYFLLYFVGIAFIIGSSMYGFEMKKSFVNTVVETPILEKTFGDSMKALDEIASMAKDYEDVEEKDEYNYKSLEILLKYKIVTADNVEYLKDNKKILY